MCGRFEEDNLIRLDRVVPSSAGLRDPLDSDRRPQINININT
jgi:hypothetical protein